MVWEVLRGGLRGLRGLGGFKGFMDLRFLRFWGCRGSGVGGRVP